MTTAVHDFKKSLSVIRGLVQLGMIASDKVRIDNYLSRIITQSDEMNDMIIEL
ncbi:hypothetical protein [Clostridium beijerinckii]|uniref:hypothetical protein n=1 Tax=Clostridium beijerinckii TaxID=1520 RepID=UPI0035A23F8C